jgi:nucleotide-binding universal stress UspA family protein
MKMEGAMVKRIMVALAFSGYSEEILLYAADLTEATGAELIVVNVINQRDLEAVDKIRSFGYKVDAEHYVETVKREKTDKLMKMLDRLTLPDNKVTYTFCTGEPTDELLKLVVDRDVDMVVMGVREKEISHLFTGSVAERMFRKCPVTVVSYRGRNVSDRLRKRFERHRHKEE